MERYVSGLLVMAYAVAALFFFRFHRDTSDRLFGIFGGAFVLLAIQRSWLALAPLGEAWEVVGYGIRLVAFVLIIWAIVDKNRRA